jgi:hypothetical protein
MAPALVETATTANAGPVPASVYKLDLGQYKEIDLTYIDKDAEAGKTDGPAATVSEAIATIGHDIDHILIRMISTLTTFPHGTLSSSTPLCSPLSTLSTARMPTPPTPTFSPAVSRSQSSLPPSALK